MKKVNKLYEVIYTGTALRFSGFSQTIQAKNEREAVERVYHQMCDNDYFPDGYGNIFDCSTNLIAGPGDIMIEHDGGYFVAGLITEKN